MNRLMNSAQPLFTIIIPTYNRAHLIKKTVDSVLAQEFGDFEILIVDDGSQDNTEEVVEMIADRRIKYHKKKNQERGAARNFGASRAMGLYVNFFDSDDLMYPNHLLVASKKIKEAINPEFFHLAYDFKDETGRIIKQVNDFSVDIQKDILFNNRLSCNGIFIRKDIAQQFPFEENRILASSEDWELWIRLSSRFKLHFSNDITSSVVNHKSRSLFTINAENVIERDLFLIDRIKADPIVKAAFKQSISRYIAERYTFFMLCLAENQKRSDVWKWAMRAAKAFPPIIFSKRFLASIKKSVMP